MRVTDYLSSTSLIDCAGHVTHTLTLQLDGMVEVQATAGGRVLVDPVRRRCLTPGARVSDQVMDLAAGLLPRA